MKTLGVNPGIALHRTTPVLYFFSGKAAKEFLVKKFSVFSIMLVILLALGLAFVACDSGGDDGGGGGSGSGTTFPSELRGTWKAEAYNGSTLSITFTSNTLTEINYPLDNATWTYSLTKIIPQTGISDFPIGYYIERDCTNVTGAYDQSYLDPYIGKSSYFEVYLNETKNQLARDFYIYTKQ